MGQYGYKRKTLRHNANNRYNNVANSPRCIYYYYYASANARAIENRDHSSV